MFQIISTSNGKIHQVLIGAVCLCEFDTNSKGIVTQVVYFDNGKTIIKKF